jgi:hypothetical protein
MSYLPITSANIKWLRANGFNAVDDAIIQHVALPNNFAIVNTAGIYSWFVKINRFNWDDTNGFASTVIHPAFTVNGIEKEIYVGKYQGCGLAATGLVDNVSSVYAGSRPNVQRQRKWESRRDHFSGEFGTLRLDHE